MYPLALFYDFSQSSMTDRRGPASAATNFAGIAA
jgi:hypothetical protein